MKVTELTIDLDAIDIEKEQGFGSGVKVVTIDFVQDGKHVHVHIDLYQHEMKSAPTLRMTAVNRTRDTTRVIQVKPWKTPTI